MKKESVKNRLRFVSPVALFFVFTFIFYGPLSLFLPNAQELWFSLGSVLKIIVPMSAAFMVVLVGVGAILPQKLRSYYITLMLGGSLAVYIQGNFLKSDYGVLDGTSIDWDSYKSYAILNTAIWIVCIILPFVARIFLKKSKDKDFTLKIFVYAALFLTAIQVPALISQAVSYEPNAQGNLAVTKEGEFELSENENTIIFILDTVDQKYYDEFKENNPDYMDSLEGFVEYNNTLSAAARTIVAIPAMFSGKAYTRDVLYSEFVTDVWSNENALSVLHDAGYDVRFYAGTSYFSSDIIDYVDNCISQNSVGSYKVLIRKLYKLTLFKFVPHILKEYVYTDTAEFDEAKNTNLYTVNDKKFISDFKNNGISVNSSYNKAVRVYLLRGAHSPYTLNSKGKKSDDATLQSQLEAGMFTVEKYIQQMKELGIYDSANIIITADHGDKNLAQQPYFLFKAAGASGDYKVSSAPISTFDLPVFLANVANTTLSNQTYGVDFTELKDDDERGRYFFRNMSDSSQPIIRKYYTESTADDLDSFAIIEDFTSTLSADTPYNLGTVLSFGTEATANVYCVDGFGLNSGFGTHVRGSHAEISIPIADIPASGALSVTIELLKFYSEHEMKITANGEVVSDCILNKDMLDSGINFDVPVELIKAADNNELTIEFEFTDLLENDSDIPIESRTLVVQFESLVIEEK